MLTGRAWEDRDALPDLVARHTRGKHAPELSTVMTAVPEVSVPGAMLADSARKARYGVAYLRSICAQAGVAMKETSPDEDVIAVDCDVDFVEAPVRVQVKCTSNFTVGGKSASWPLEEGWLRKWEQSLVPVYFVLVIVKKDVNAWLDHPATSTVHRSAAFWRRIRPGELGSTIAIPKAQRLTVATLAQWHADLLESFTGGGAL